MQRRSRRKHKCCNCAAQTAYAIMFLLTSIFFMAMLQLYPDSLPDFPGENVTLPDTGFKIIPQLSDEYTHTADIWILVTIVVFLLMLTFTRIMDFPQLALRRWLILLAFLYMLRGLTIICTRYPRLPFAIEKYHPSNAK